MKRLLLPLFLLILAGSLALVGVVVFQTQPVTTSVVSTQPFTVDKGMSLSQVADKLQEEGIVRSALIIRFILKQQNNPTVQSGSYDLSSSMTPFEIVTALSKGAKDTWVTLLEGWRREEMAIELEGQLGTKWFHKDEFLALTADKEGMLFPDTYLFPKQTTAQSVVDTLTQTFNRKAAKLLSQSSSTLTPSELLILASIIQREARDTTDMHTVSGILMNRLNMGMPLQVDATLQYAHGFSKQTQTWWPEPTASDRETPSAFNTYTNKGLPPTPICDPGLEAIDAAVHPDKTDFLFYISDRQGVMHYAHTLAEHDALIQQYLR